MHRHSIKQCRLLILGTSAIQLMWLAPSCTEDHYGEAQANAIRFEVVSDAPEAASRSCCLAESVEGDSLCLCAQITDYRSEVEMEAEKSRAALSTSPGNFLLSCAIFDNGSSAFKNYYFQGEKYNSAGTNAAGNSFYWLSTGNSKYRFYGIAPYEKSSASNGYTVDYSGGAGEPTIQFKVPAEADNQFDLMSVTTTDYADNHKTDVTLSFSHLCTAVTFSADPSCAGITIDEVRIKGVYNSGTYDMASKSWKVNTGSTANYSKVLKKDITAGDYSITASGQATFFLLPQTIPSGATVEVVYITSSGTSTLSASLSDMVWSAGKKVNFVVSPTLISAEQEGLHIKGIASPEVIGASGTSFSIKKSGTELADYGTLKGANGDGDLIYAYNKFGKATDANKTTAVSLNFKHMLSKVAFKFTNNMPSGTIRIDDLKVESVDPVGTIDLDAATPAWERTGGVDKFDMDYASDMNGISTDGIAAGANGTTLYNIFIPGTFSYKVSFKIDLKKDAVTLATYTHSVEFATAPVMAIGTAYVFSATIDATNIDPAGALSPITFTSSVSAWTDDTPQTLK